MDLFVIDTERDENLLEKTSEVEDNVESESESEEIDQNAGRFVRLMRNSESSDECFVAESKKDQKEEVVEEETEDEDDDEDFDYRGIPPPSVDISHILKEFLDELAAKEKPKLSKKEQEIEDAFNKCSLDDLFTSRKKDSARNEKFVTTGIEFVKDLKSLGMSNNMRKKINKKEREKTKGNKWYNLPAPEMTEELKNELEVIKMRNALDPKRFYKRSENKSLPKYFEVGKVMDSPLDYHSTKNVRKTKAKTLVDELMEDADFQKFQKKKFKEAEEHKKHSTYNKALKKMKKIKKNK